MQIVTNRRVPDDVVGSEALQRAARFGFVVRGGLYLLVGGLAARLALRDPSRDPDATGALGAIAHQPLAGWLLGLVVAGLAALTLWRLARGLLDTERRGRDARGLVRRAGDLGHASVYGAGCAVALSFLLGERTATADADLTARAFELPLGRWLVAGVGLVIAAATAIMGARTVRGGYRDTLKLEELDVGMRPPVVGLAVAALVGRLLVFLLVGLFLVRAAVQYEPREGVGLDGALRTLIQQPVGPLWVGAVAVGLVLFGCYSMLEARYREVLET